MGIRQMTTHWLLDHKYEGLYCEECCCDIDGLMHCDVVSGDYPDMEHCHPGYKVVINDSHHYHIVANKLQEVK